MRRVEIDGAGLIVDGMGGFRVELPKRAYYECERSFSGNEEDAEVLQTLLRLYLEGKGER